MLVDLVAIVVVVANSQWGLVATYGGENASDQTQLKRLRVKTSVTGQTQSGSPASPFAAVTSSKNAEQSETVSGDAA